jgi:hypothetical protein
MDTPLTASNEQENGLISSLEHCTLDGDAPLYSQLERNEIRLLSVISNDDQILVCRLDTYHRLEAPEFDALSYCWGESTETTTIICNNKELPILTSLYVALQHLISGSACLQRPLWIDAISLNQCDGHEKAHQVPRMNRIYESPTETLIWVGQAAEDSDRALKFLRVLDLDTENCGYTKGVKNKLTFLDTDHGAHLLRAIEALVHRSCF